MIWVDWAIVAMIFISMLIAFLRGMTREAIGLAAWILGTYLAFIYAPHLQTLLESQIQTPEFRYLIVFVSILIIFLILGALGGKLMGHLVSAIGLAGLDKSLGIIFGLARAILLVVLFIMVANFTPIAQSDNWKNSWFIVKLKPQADQLLNWMDKKGFIPQDSNTIKR